MRSKNCVWRTEPGNGKIELTKRPQWWFVTHTHTLSLSLSIFLCLCFCFRQSLWFRFAGLSLSLPSSLPPIFLEHWSGTISSWQPYHTTTQGKDEALLSSSSCIYSLCLCLADSLSLSLSHFHLCDQVKQRSTTIKEKRKTTRQPKHPYKHPIGTVVAGKRRHVRRSQWWFYEPVVPVVLDSVLVDTNCSRMKHKSLKVIVCCS